MNLAGAPLQLSVRVTSVQVQSPSAYRLMEMGLIEGAEVQVVRRAPLGDPLQVCLGDYELSLRSRDAELVDVIAA